MSDAVRIDLLILAAGSSLRLGSPKALVEIGGRTSLERVLDTAATAGVRSGVVVGGEHLEQMKARIDPAPVQFARNPTPEAGRMGSVLIGLAATDRAADILLWPVDRPFAQVQTVQTLLAAREAEPGKDVVVVPVEGGSHGHPIVIAAGLRETLLRASPDANLRDVLTRAGAHRFAVPVLDPRVHWNLDTPEDLQRVRSNFP